MENITVAIIDHFAPAILEKIRKKIPQTWQISIISENTLKARKSALKEAHVTLMMAAKLNNELLQSAPHLLYIQKMGAGVDNIDIDYCKEHHIGVARLNAGNDIPVAEHTVMMILAASRNLIYFDQQTRIGNWGKEAARGSTKQVHGKTVGIIGLGAIGRRVAKLLQNFDARLIYCDPVPAPEELSTLLKLERMGLDDIITSSDIITLHLPLNTETKGIITSERIDSMKSGAVFVNCARGGLVDEKALAAAIKRDHLFAAGLDTFSSEPPNNSPFIPMSNIVLSPHCAGATLDNFDSIMERSINNALAFLNNKPLPNKDLIYDPRPTTS